MTALDYAAHGFAVLPCKPMQKLPLTRHGLRDATTDAAVIRRWSRCNFGILPGPDVLVLDADSPEEANALEREFPELRTAPKSRTPSGGAHFFVRLPPGAPELKASVRVQGRALDVRGLGRAYVVAEPSTTPKGSYRWERALVPPAVLPVASRALLELLSPQKKPLHPTPYRSLDVNRDRNAYVRTAVKAEHDAVASAGEGSRNDRLNTAAYNLGQLVGGRHLSRTEAENALTAAAATAGLEPGETEATIRSGLDAGELQPRNIPDRTPTPKTKKTSTKPTAAKPKDAPTPSVFSPVTGRELMGRELRPPTFVVPDLLPVGLAVFAARPKMGKSWLALALAADLTTGGRALGKIQLKRMGALYLGLEDSERRLQSRLRLILHGAEPPEGLHLAAGGTFPRLDLGGFDALNSWLKAHPDVKLVVLDTLARVRPPRQRNGDIYQEDAELGSRLQKIALERDVCFLVIHHTTKAKTEDFLDSVSGSSGLTGVADAVLVLSRARGEADGTLKVTGRDVEESEHPLRFDAAEGRWSLLGDTAIYGRTEERKKILAFLERTTKPVGPSTICAATGIPYSSLRNILGRMFSEGALESPKRGLYTLNKNIKREGDFSDKRAIGDMGDKGDKAFNPSLFPSQPLSLLSPLSPFVVREEQGRVTHLFERWKRRELMGRVLELDGKTISDLEVYLRPLFAERLDGNRAAHLLRIANALEVSP